MQSSENTRAYGAFAAVYDRLMEDVDYGAWYRHYRALLCHAGVAKPRRIADICCGTGSFAIRFAKDGVSAVGVDLSEEMLAVAQQRARKAGARVPFVRMDATELELPRPVDAIVCACDGVNYLATPERAQAFFACANGALKPGGVLAFDVSAEHKFVTMLDGRAYGEDMQDLCYLWTNDYSGETRLCHMELTLFTRGEDGRFARTFEAHEQRAHSARELAAWLGGAGFSGIEVFSEMTLAPHTDKDDRMHVVAVRQ